MVDYGLVGLALWLAAYLVLVRYTWRRWKVVRGSRTAAEHIHAAAFLVLIGLALTMIVDNPLIEVAKMGPVSVIVGMSLGLPAVQRATATRSWRSVKLAAATAE